MKKILKICGILILFLFMYKVIIKFFINRHSYDYSIVTKNNKYKIKEDYEDNNYIFTIKDKKNKEFVYHYYQDLNKQSKIITDIISYKKKNLYCIAPVFNNDIENIVCLLNNKLVSYQYLKQINNTEIDSFIKKLNNNSYNTNKIFQKENKVINNKYNLDIYNNVSDKFHIVLWNYSRIFLINDNHIKKVDLLKKDAYENNFSILVDKYYIVVNTDNPYYNKYFIVDIEKGTKNIIKINDEISKKVHFNGIYKNKLYLTDLENRKQYLLNPKKGQLTQIDPKYYNGEKLLNISVDDLVGEKADFSINKKENSFQKKYNNYTTKNGYIYQTINNKKIILFKFDDFNELKVVGNTVFGINNDTLYMYSNKEGLKKILSNRELIYNFKNIYDIIYVK